MINKKNKYKKNYSNRLIKIKLYNLKRNTKNSIITWSNILSIILNLSLNLYLGFHANLVPTNN